MEQKAKRTNRIANYRGTPEPAVITPVRGRTTQGCGVPRTSCKPFCATTGKARAVCNGEPTPGKATPAQPVGGGWRRGPARAGQKPRACRKCYGGGDRKSTRLNSSHGSISYAVFCLKKKKLKL